MLYQEKIAYYQRWLSDLECQSDFDLEMLDYVERLLGKLLLEAAGCDVIEVECLIGSGSACF